MFQVCKESYRVFVWSEGDATAIIELTLIRTWTLFFPQCCAM